MFEIFVEHECVHLLSANVAFFSSDVQTTKLLWKKEKDSLGSKRLHAWSLYVISLKRRRAVLFRSVGLQALVSGSLRTADVSPRSSPLRDVSRGGTSAIQRQKFHTDDVNQCLLNKSGSHGVPNANLFNFTFSWSILDDFFFVFICE